MKQNKITGRQLVGEDLCVAGAVMGRIKTIFTILFLTGILVGCTSHRYSARVVQKMTPCPLDVGSYQIVAIDCGIDLLGFKASKTFMNAVQAQEPDYGCRERIKISIQPIQGVAKKQNGGIMLNLISLGIIPACCLNRCYYTVDVYSLDKNRKIGSFSLTLEHRSRFTPFGLWSFIGTDFREECYAAEYRMDSVSNSKALAEVLAQTLSDGLTNNWKGNQK